MANLDILSLAAKVGMASDPVAKLGRRLLTKSPNPSLQSQDLYNLKETWAETSLQKVQDWNQGNGKVKRDGREEKFFFSWKTPDLPKWALPVVQNGAETGETTLIQPKHGGGGVNPPQDENKGTQGKYDDDFDIVNGDNIPF